MLAQGFLFRSVRVHTELCYSLVRSGSGCAKNNRKPLALLLLFLLLYKCATQQCKIEILQPGS